MNLKIRIQKLRIIETTGNCSGVGRHYTTAMPGIHTLHNATITGMKRWLR